MAKPTVLLVGDKDSREFSPATQQLFGQTDCRWFPDTAAAIPWAGQTESPPDVVVVAQSRPGQYDLRQIDRLRRTAPLARYILLLGTLCEGEARTGRPWPGAARIYWHQWAPRFARELERLSVGRCPAWGLPMTATADEIIEYATDADAAAPTRSGLLAIRAALGGTYDALSAACRAAGYATVWLRDDQQVQLEGPAAVIWDDRHCDRPQAARIRAIAAAVRPAPVLVLLHFPRVGDRDRALAAGARAVLSKPLLLDDLLWHLDQFSKKQS